jgi:hypothetical protein
MADTFLRATKSAEISQDIKKFAQGFYNKVQEQQMKQQAGAKSFFKTSIK